MKEFKWLQSRVQCVCERVKFCVNAWVNKGLRVRVWVSQHRCLLKTTWSALVCVWVFNVGCRDDYEDSDLSIQRPVGKNGKENVEMF